MKNKFDILLLYLTWHLKSSWMRQVAGRINGNCILSEQRQMANFTVVLTTLSFFAKANGNYTFISQCAALLINKLVYFPKNIYVPPLLTIRHTTYQNR